MLDAKAIPSLDLIDLQDLIGDVEDGLQCLYMSIQTLPKKERDALLFLVGILEVKFTFIAEQFDGEVGNA